MQTTFTIEDGKLVQKQILNGDLSSQLIREIVDGKLKIVSVIVGVVVIYTKVDNYFIFINFQVCKGPIYFTIYIEGEVGTRNLTKTGSEVIGGCL